MNFLNGLGNIFDLSTILGLNNAEGKQGGSKPKSQRSGSSTRPPTSNSSGRTSPLTSGPRPSLSSPTLPPTRPLIAYRGLRTPETLNPEEFKSFMKSLKNAKDIKDFKRIFNEHKNKLTHSQKEKLQDSLIKKLELRNDRLSVTMSQLIKQHKTLKQSMAKLKQPFTENSRVLRSYENSLSNETTGNGDPTIIRNLTAGVNNYKKVVGIQEQVLVDQRDQLTSIQHKIYSARANIDANKEKIDVLNKFTGSPRISGG
jgi:hypothetical protein